MIERRSAPLFRRASQEDSTTDAPCQKKTPIQFSTRNADIKAEPKLESDELWFQDAIIYRLHVKAFADSNNDGMGDFAGLTEKLDYLEDLGVTALWLLPFYPSSGRDDGYDISDYLHINPDFGTMQDFRRFMQEARRKSCG